MVDCRMKRIMMVLFSLAGIAIIILVWGRPMPLSERIMATIFGSLGLIWGVVQVSSMLYMVVHNGRRKGVTQYHLRRKTY